MKKLKLNLDEINVKSFEAAIQNNEKGTVIGFDDPTVTCYTVPPGCPYTMEDCQRI